jgi:hypothetical protein
MAIFYSKDSNVTDTAQMDEWCPDFDYPAMPSVDTVKAKLPGPGVFKIKFGNQQAWFRSLTLHYRVLFVDKDNQPVNCEQQTNA